MVVPSGSQWFPVVPGGSRWFPVVPGGSQWFPVVPSGSQWFPVVPDHARESLESQPDHSNHGSVQKLTHTR